MRILAWMVALLAWGLFAVTDVVELLYTSLGCFVLLLIAYTLRGSIVGVGIALLFFGGALISLSSHM